MNVTIIPDDKSIGVDGVFHVFDFIIDSDIHAIHWDGVKGEVEYKSKTSEKINKFSSYEYLLIERSTSMRVAAEALIVAKEAEKASMLDSDKRVLGGPTSEEQLNALYDARKGNNTALLVIDAAIANVRIKYPV